MNRFNHNIVGQLSKDKGFSLQKVITVTALLLLLVAVQVSTQSVEAWFVFGLNVVEVTAPINGSISEVTNVNSGFLGGLHHVSEMVWKSVKALVEAIFH